MWDFFFLFLLVAKRLNALCVGRCIETGEHRKSNSFCDNTSSTLQAAGFTVTTVTVIALCVGAMGQETTEDSILYENSEASSSYRRHSHYNNDYYVVWRCHATSDHRGSHYL